MADYMLFLDDERMPGDVTWVSLPSAVYRIVRSYDEFVDYITKNGVPSFVTFDHDLADQHYNGNYNDERTGYDCAKFLVDFCADNGVKFPDYQIHSMNPIGRTNIDSYIRNAKIVLGI